MPEVLQEAFDAAFEQALLALGENEVPVGAVIVKDKKIIARSRNQIIAQRNPTAHAERLVIEEAARLLSNERLTGCSLYTTLEPCVMCSGAIILSRIEEVFFLAVDRKLPALREVLALKNHNHYPSWYHCPRPDLDYEEVLKGFFREKRKSGQGRGESSDI